jgi:hypothetical protein
MAGSAATGLVTANPAMGAAGLVSSEPVEKRGKNPQEAADQIGVARIVIVVDRHGEVIEGSQRVAVFGLEEAQVGRKV